MLEVYIWIAAQEATAKDRKHSEESKHMQVGLDIYELTYNKAVLDVHDAQRDDWRGGAIRILELSVRFCHERELLPHVNRDCLLSTHPPTTLNSLPDGIFGYKCDCEGWLCAETLLYNVQKLWFVNKKYIMPVEYQTLPDPSQTVPSFTFGTHQYAA
jgi:hypothetical protein